MKPNRERLLAVARAVREAPGTFDMSNWVHPCGAPACAIGHYVARTDLQQRFAPRRILPLTKHAGLSSSQLYQLRTTMRDKVSHKAVDYAGREIHEHLGLTDVQYSRLFNSDGCGGAQSREGVAHYIEQWVRNNCDIDSDE